MTTTNAFGRSLIAIGITAALSTNLVLAQEAGSKPADQNSEELNEIVVTAITGSRTITDVLKSPTPITSVDVNELSVTTPSDTADALNKLPSILGGRTPRNQGNGSTNNGGNTLSLRNFGPQRTLVLLDGHRVAPSNQDGSVNIDVLPQMLVKNVDIVTGGASAVYGSDAVAGVVNYMLDKNFTGLTVKGDYGTSNKSDGDAYQVGAAWGTALFSDRGHFEVSARMRHQDEILMKDRPGGENGQAWLQVGGGTPTNPFKFVPYARVFDSAQQGNVICGSGCAVNGTTFDANGNLVPLVHGVPSLPGSNIETGGDGAYIKYGTFRSGLDAKDIFARFSLDLGEHANWYAQGSWAESEDASDWIQMVASPNAGRPSTLFANNPYLNAASRAALGGNLSCTTDLTTAAARASRRCLIANPAAPTTGGPAPPPPADVPTFRLPRYFNVIDGQDVIDKPNRLYRTLGDQKAWNTETGITGEAGRFTWDVFFNHSVSDLEVTNPNNTDNAKYLAALDAVDDGGTIKCWVTTQPQFASLYPGCVPMNITTPGGMSAAAYDYVRTPTSWLLTQKMDNVGASISGGLWGFGLPAGEITASLSVDARWQTYDMQSDFNPSEIVNCAGLRLCTAGAGNGGGGNPTTQQATPPARWVQNTNGSVSSKNHVYEGALELNIPLLAEAPGFQDLSTNLAGRYTKYSTFDAVESWKIGINWKVVDSVRLRSTLSADIRAPNLNDMFQPVTIGSTSFTDLLTGGSAQGIKRFSQGNALLNPETAKTFTAGIVLTPSFLPRFSWSLDYYQTRLTNAITALGYDQNSTQLTCLASAPAYNASACDLVTRPINNPSDPNFLNPLVNLPTEIRSAPVNAALQKTKGYDMEVNYNVDLWGGQFSLRHLVTYQPVNSTLATPVAKFYTWAVQPHWLQTTFLSYKNQSWEVALQNRWLGSTSLESSNNLLNATNGVPTPNSGAQNYVDSSLDANDVVDITIGKEFEVSSGKLQAFLSVSNVLDERAPLAPSNSGLPGLFYPTLGFYDDMGRYFTAGVKMKF